MPEDSEALWEIHVFATARQARPGSDGAWLEVAHVLERKGANEDPWVALQGDDRSPRNEEALSTLGVDRRRGTFDHVSGAGPAGCFSVATGRAVSPGGDCCW